MSAAPTVLSRHRHGRVKSAGLGALNAPDLLGQNSSAFLLRSARSGGCAYWPQHDPIVCVAPIRRSAPSLLAGIATLAAATQATARIVTDRLFTAMQKEFEVSASEWEQAETVVRGCRGLWANSAGGWGSQPFEDV